MSRIPFLYPVLWMLLLNSSHAQECMHTNLSYKFNYNLKLSRKKNGDNGHGTGEVTLSIYKKNSVLIQTVNFEAPFLFEGVFGNCHNVRSHVTEYNKDNTVADFDFGDLIVADLNFDGKEDFAVKYDSGGNGGPSYRFYIQDSNGSFKLDRFLTSNVGSFPEYINAMRRTLTTHINANGKTKNEKTYKYYPKTKKWRMIKWDDSPD